MSNDPMVQELTQAAERIRLREQLQAHEKNARHTNIVIGCLVKRLGHIVADGQGHAYQVILTDEELTELEGSLEVRRDFSCAGIILTLHDPKPHVVESTKEKTE